MLTDISGQLIQYVGQLSSTKGTGLGVLSAAGFAAGAEIGNFLGLLNENGFNRLLLEGDLASVYITLVGDELLFITAFTKQTTLGKVRIFVDEARVSLLAMIEQAVQARDSATRDGQFGVDNRFSIDIGRQLDELF